MRFLGIHMLAQISAFKFQMMFSLRDNQTVNVECHAS